MFKVKIVPWRVMGKKLFWSRDRLVKHEFDCLRLGFALSRGLETSAPVVARNHMVRGRLGLGLRL